MPSRYVILYAETLQSSFALPAAYNAFCTHQEQRSPSQKCRQLSWECWPISNSGVSNRSTIEQPNDPCTSLRYAYAPTRAQGKRGISPVYRTRERRSKVQQYSTQSPPAATVTCRSRSGLDRSVSYSGEGQRKPGLHKLRRYLCDEQTNQQ